MPSLYDDVVQILSFYNRSSVLEESETNKSIQLRKETIGYRVESVTHHFAKVILCI